MEQKKQMFTDEELTAFLDNAGDPEKNALIRAALETDTALQDRLNALDFPLSALQIEANAALSDAPFPDLPRARPFAGAWSMAAALVIGIGLGLALIPRSEPTRDWVDYAAAYQALYVTETLADVPTADPETQLSELSTKINKDLTKAGDLPGIEFRRAQELGFAGQSLIQIAYLTPGDVPIALCIIKNDGSTEGMTNSLIEGLASAYWSDGSHAYLVIGGQDASLVTQIAEAARSLL